MNFRIDRFEEMQFKTRLNDHQLELKSGLGRGTISKWKKGTRVPSANSLSKVANTFNCDLEYLWGLTDVPRIDVGNAIKEYASENNIDLSPEEVLLLDKFRKANAEGKFKIIQVAMNEGEE